MNEQQISKSILINLGILLLYVLIGSSVLQNRQGGADIFFAAIVAVALVIHLAVLLILLVGRLVQGDPSWKNAGVGIGTILLAVLGYAVYAKLTQPVENPLERQESQQRHRERKRTNYFVNNSLRKATNIDGKVGFVDDNRQLIIPYMYDETTGFFNLDSLIVVDTLAAVKKMGKWGFINLRGEIKIPFDYDGADRFGGQLAPVAKDGLWGFINHSGKLIVPLQYEGALSFNYGLAPVKIKGQWGYIDTTGRMVISPKYSWASVFKNGYAFGEIGNKVLEFNKKGEVFRINPAQ